MTPVQTGRVFVSAEAFAGASRLLAVGKIAFFGKADFPKPTTPPQSYGSPHRLRFDVSESLRGERSRVLDLVLSVQTTLFLEYLRDRQTTILLAAGPTALESHPRPEVGMEEDGRPVETDWYRFRVLDPLRLPKPVRERSVAEQINIRYDSGRMFTLGLEIVRGRREILSRVRAFVKRHPETMSTVSLRVPNDFGALCGSPNAYCSIALPVCPETKATLLRLKTDPDRILRRIRSDRKETIRAELAEAVDSALAQFEETP